MIQLVASDTTVRKAADWLAEHDPVLAPVILQTGLCPIRPHTDYYWELVDSIISQQLSVKAARTIEKRFCDLFATDRPTPEQILQKTIDDLRTAGLSRAKAAYIRDLAQHIASGSLKIDTIATLSNADVIKTLTVVKGIGEWTAHMFLMFSLGRLDILATGDLGIKNGVQKLYNLPTLPDAVAITKIAADNTWHPYETIACWYVWQSLAAPTASAAPLPTRP